MKGLTMIAGRALALLQILWFCSESDSLEVGGTRILLRGLEIQKGLA